MVMAIADFWFTCVSVIIIGFHPAHTKTSQDLQCMPHKNTFSTKINTMENHEKIFFLHSRVLSGDI